jgi:hypothetical protein
MMCFNPLDLSRTNLSGHSHKHTGILHSADIENAIRQNERLFWGQKVKPVTVILADNP